MRVGLSVHAAVLLLAGIGLNFPHISWRGLCFLFVLETVSMKEGCSHSCGAGLTVSEPFLPLTPSHQGEGWGYTGGWERTKPGDLHN